MTCSLGNASLTPLHARVPAGGNITARWYNTWNPTVYPNEWKHDRGPLLAYMARCPGITCDNWDGTGSVWFKIAELAGNEHPANTSDRYWWMPGLIGGRPSKTRPDPSWTVTVPMNLEPGAYLVRHELIVIPGRPLNPDNPGQPEFFPSCAQLIVEGQGTERPTSKYLVSLPGAYKLSGWCISLLS